MSELRKRIIDDYFDMLEHIKFGRFYNYDRILDMISFLEVGSKTINPQMVQNYLIHE